MSRITPDQSRQLDSIRALSAFIVLIGHTNQTLIAPTVKYGSVFIGFFTQLSVMAFFVLSGFLIGKSICNNVVKNNTFSIKQYSIDRALRIYPPLISALLLMIVLALIAPYLFPSGTNSLLLIPGAKFVRTEFRIVSSELWATLIFLSNFKTLIPSSLDAIGLLNQFKTYTPSTNSPLWSLSIEVWYYVLAAVIFVWPSRKILAVILAVVTLMVTYTNQLFIMLSPVWFSGFGLAFVHQRYPKMHNQLFGWLFAILTLATAFTVALLLFSDPLGNGVWLDRMNHFRLVSGLWFSCFMALIMGGGARFPTIFHSHACYSYTLYVIHFPVMLFILGVTQTVIYGSVLLSLLVSIATIVISIAIAKSIASYAENKQLSHSIASKAFGVMRAKIAK